jgi:hypothetical protein
MTAQRRTASAAQTERVAQALDAARQSQTLVVALRASEAMHQLVAKLRDELADEDKRDPALAATLSQLGAALQQVDKLRLDNRQFVDVSVEELLQELAERGALATFERKYEGRHVRWRLKFKDKHDGRSFVAHAGPHVEVVCALDPCVPEGTVDRLEPWQMLTVEARFARLETFGKASDPRRARIAFDQCIVVS